MACKGILMLRHLRSSRKYRNLTMEYLMVYSARLYGATPQYVADRRKDGKE